MITRGVLYVHSAAKAFCPHVEWAVANVIGVPVSMDWTDQPAAPGTLRAEYSWQGPQGTGARLASALRGWVHLRYEVSEEPSFGVDGGRWFHTPSLGICHAVTDVHGNLLIRADQVLYALEHGYDLVSLRHKLAVALAEPWDDELEPFRCAGAGAPVRWLHQVG
ncbi:MAG: DUF3145 domain-containing protein [Bifidobacteriaceae bacterium]|nr:DUF3145 domain-containing protein [Bifidobacteriaceae bacterium]